MKVFLAGGTGVTGRRLIPKLLQAGHSTVGFILWSSSEGFRISSPGPKRPSLFDNIPMNFSSQPGQLETLIPAERIRQAVEELGRRITADYPERAGEPPLHLIGVLKGSFVFLADLVRAIGREVSIDFVGATSYGSSTKTSGEIQLTKDLDEDIAGRDVLLVEDIVDTGLTLDWLCGQLSRRGPRSLRVVTLLDKPSRRIKPVELAYVGLEIPDMFLVGYGLDYDQRYRHLPGLYVLREETT